MDGWIERCMMFGEVESGTNGLGRTILGEDAPVADLIMEGGYGNAAINKEQNDINSLNELFRMHRMNDEVVRNATSELDDKRGKDGEFTDGPRKGQAFEMKHQPQPPGMEDVIKVTLAIQYEGRGAVLRHEGADWVNGWLNKELPQYLVWYVGPMRFYIVPFESLRSVVARALGIDASELKGNSPEAIRYVLDYSQGVKEYPGLGYPFREYYENRWNVNVAVSKSAIPGLIDLKPPTAEEEVEYGRREAEAKRKAAEENARRQREEEERRKAEQTAAKTEMDEILAADSLVCPFDGTPLKWNPKKKAIRCTKGGERSQNTGKSVGGQQLCGHIGSQGAGRGGVQGSDLNKIKGKYHSNKDFQSEEIITRAINAYKKLLFTLDKRVIPTEREQLRANLVRAGEMANDPKQLDARMRQGLVRNGMNPDEWDLLVASGRFKDVPPAEVRERKRSLEARGYGK